MGKRKSLLSVMICICLLVTACGNGAEEAAKRADGGRIEREATGAAVSDTTDTTIRPKGLPDKLTATGDGADVTFFIRERTEQGYRARVNVKGWGEDDEEEWDSVYPEWELCLELNDEITEITGAEIKSREGNFYTIQGRIEEDRFGGMGENEDAYIIWFDVEVACPNGAHGLGSCYWKMPDKLKATGGDVDVTFYIKKRTKQGYRARVKVKEWGAYGDEEEWDAVYPEWELCLELKDEITEITGAEIKSREGNLYTIQGRLKETIFGDDGENEEAYTIWFDVAVACPNGAHYLGSCYWKSKYEDIDLPEEDYKIETLEEKIQGRKMRVKLRLTNCSGKEMERWLLWIGTNFDIRSISGAEICFEYEWDIGDYCVCGEKGNRSLGKGESVEITFSGECEKEFGKPSWWTRDVEVAKDMKKTHFTDAGNGE